MSSSSSPLSPPPIQWRQILSLAAVQAAISLMWVMYGLYLPQLLGQLGMPAEAAGWILVVENALAIPLQPFIGFLSDRRLQWAGSRFPLIAIGVILASILFIAIPVLPVLFQSSLAVQRLVLFVLVAWSVAMVLFYSPMLALLAKYAAVPQLPLANSALILASGLIGTTRPMVNQMILGFGPFATFIVGSIVLLGAATVLRQADIPQAPNPVQPGESLTALVPSFAAIGILGAALGWAMRSLMDLFGKTFFAQLPDLNTGHLMTTVMVALALCAVPAGWLATRYGNRRMIGVGIIAALIGSSGLVLVPGGASIVLCSAVLVISLSLMQNGAFPLAIALVPSAKVGISIGMYLGGLAAANTVFGIYFPRTDVLSPQFVLTMAVLALILGLLAVLATYRTESWHTEPKV